MTLLERPGSRRLTAGLTRVETGVRRLASADEDPVILLSDLAPDVVEALAPLLARRRDVYVADGSLAAAPGWPRAALVGGPLAVAAAAAAREIEAVVVVGPSAPLAPFDGPVLVVTAEVDGATADPSSVPSTDASPVGSAVAAVSGHPVETAHLVDSFLRDPLRHPAGTRLDRARP